MDKIEGCIYGVVVGDALGTTYEFRKAASIKLPETLNIVGGGPFKVKKGQVTDDSEMTIAMLRSIIRMGKYDKNDVAKAYIRWMESEPADSGLTTRKALMGATNYKEVVAHSMERNQGSLSNGFLMRISPLAVYGMRLKPSKLNKHIMEEIAMTNPSDICYYAAKLYIHMLIYLMKGGQNIEKEALRIIALDKHKGVPELKNIVLSAKVTPYFKYAADTGVDDIVAIDGEYMGFFAVTLQLSFHELYHAKNYEEAMRGIIKHGGDTDTNCAIAGGLLGAKFGYNNIPRRWVTAVNQAKYNRPMEFQFDSKLVEEMF